MSSKEMTISTKQAQLFAVSIYEVLRADMMGEKRAKYTEQKKEPIALNITRSETVQVLPLEEAG